MEAIHRASRIFMYLLRHSGESFIIEEVLAICMMYIFILDIKYIIHISHK